MGDVNGTSPADGRQHLAELISRRRRLISSGVVFGLVIVGVVGGLIALTFSADRQAWNDDSRVVQTRGLVVEEVAGTGSCKGADFDTLVEWTDGDELRSAWTSTCRSGPDVGDEVDLWVRDDGEVALKAPGATTVLTVVGILFFAGLGALTFFSLRFNLRKVNRELAHARPAAE